MCSRFCWAKSILRTSAKYFKWSHLPSWTREVFWSWITHHQRSSIWSKARTGGNILKLLYHAVGIHARKQALENTLDHSGQNPAQWMGWASENTKCQLKNSSHVACTEQPAKSSNKSSKGFSARRLFCNWANCFLSHISANSPSVTNLKHLNPSVCLISIWALWTKESNAIC